MCKAQTQLAFADQSRRRQLARGPTSANTITCEPNICHMALNCDKGFPPARQCPLLNLHAHTGPGKAQFTWVGADLLYYKAHNWRPSTAGHLLKHHSRVNDLEAQIPCIFSASPVLGFGKESLNINISVSSTHFQTKYDI